MSKILDWNKIEDTTSFDDQRRKKVGQTTFKELMENAYRRDDEQKAHQDLVKSQEPFLRNGLLKCMINRTPLRVLTAFMNPTESMSGQDTQDEIEDSFWNGVSANDPIKKAERMASSRFEEVMETIPAGAELMFKSWNKTLGQWVFVDQNTDREFAIYDKPNVMFQNAQIRNPGFYGLLFNTHLVQELGD